MHESGKGDETEFRALLFRAVQQSLKCPIGGNARVVGVANMSNMFIIYRGCLLLVLFVTRNEQAQAVEEEVSNYVKQEDETRFRCKVPECVKLFKAENFWRKHVEKRHPEWFEKIKKDVSSCSRSLMTPLASLTIYADDPCEQLRSRSCPHCAFTV